MKPNAQDVQKLESHQLINQNSKRVEYFTPTHIIEAARVAMGSIDLDPASCAEANTYYVRAPYFFTKELDGLTEKWFGNVWMNHPFTAGKNHLWIDKLVSEYEARNVDAACCITWASTSEKWFRPLLAYPQCFPFGRVNYVLPGGQKTKQATKGSVITYLGPNVERFAFAFSKIGVIKVPYESQYTEGAANG